MTENHSHKDQGPAAGEEKVNPPTGTKFLPCLYRIYAGCATLSVLICTLTGGFEAGLSNGFGSLVMGLVVVGWDVTLAFTLKPDHTSSSFHMMVGFLRYILLGGLFYAMISLFAVKWLWFFAGTILIIPALLMTTFVCDKEPHTS